MVVMERCCCCSVRTACLIFGVLALMGSISQIGKDAKEILKTDRERDNDVKTIVHELAREGIAVDEENIRSIEDYMHYICYPDLIMSIGWIVSAGCLIYGVRSKEPNFLIPALVIYALDAVMRLIIVLILIIVFGFSHPLTIMILMVFVLGIIFSALIALCVYSHWQQLKEEEGPTQRSYNASSKV